MAKTTRQSFQFMLRLPDDLRDALRIAAEGGGRSVTAEIIARLEETFGRQSDGVRAVWLPAELWARVEHEANVEAMDPNLVILSAIENAFPAKLDVADRLRALVEDVDRRGIAHTKEGQEILQALDRLIGEREDNGASRRPWKASKP